MRVISCKLRSPEGLEVEYSISKRDIVEKHRIETPEDPQEELFMALSGLKNALQEEYQTDANVSITGFSISTKGDTDIVCIKGKLECVSGVKGISSPLLNAESVTGIEKCIKEVKKFINGERGATMLNVAEPKEEEAA